MRRKRGVKEHGGEGQGMPGAHRTAIAVLVTANLAAFAATLHILRQLGQAETLSSSSFSQPDVDLTGLYEFSAQIVADDLDISGVYKDDAGVAPPGPEAAAAPSLPGSQAPRSQVKELFQIPAGATVDPKMAAAIAAIAQSPPAQQAAPQWRPVPGSATPVRPAPGQGPPMVGGPGKPAVLAPTGVLSAAVRTLAKEAVKLCPPCGAKVHGPLPTTLRAKWPSADACQWVEHPQMFLSDLSADIDFRYELSTAKEFCIELAHDCYGVTCEAPNRCTVRAGTHLTTSPNAAEVTHVKACGNTFYATAGQASTAEDARAGKCERDEAPAPPVSSGAEELQGAAIVILAHSRGDALKICLESLLSQEEIKLFKIFVSLDLKESVDSMTAVVKQAQRDSGVEINVWEVEKFVGDPAKHNKDQIAWFQYNAGKIAHHYWVAFERVFAQEKYKYAIFLEEDLVSAPDFLALFRSTSWILEQDPSIWCIGAWNDIGMSAAFSDQCRLTRTSYFPGLGFLLTREAWMRLRTMWPTAPTMGWDYWMRVGFRKEGKECIIPEVPRSRHLTSTGGSSITSNKQFKIFKSMALAQTESTCNLEGRCHQFGDVSYLLENKYAEWLSKAVTSLPKLPVEEIRIGAIMDRTQTYVVPYIFEEYGSIVEMVGIRPRGTKMAIPQDIRSEHYGLLQGRHLQSRARLLLVDRRSPLGYLPPAQQLRMRPDSLTVGGAKGLSCTAVCQQKQMQCNEREMHFINNCKTLETHFACEAGCAHQVGKELPVYVPDETQPTYRQCLVTFISPMKCESFHKSTARLCACIPVGGAR